MEINDVDIKIGRVLFETTDAKELAKVGYGLFQLYEQSEYEDNVSGTMAIEASIAAYFAGVKGAAYIIASCLLAGLPYRSLSGEDKVNLLGAYCESAADESSMCAAKMGELYSIGLPPYFEKNEYLSTIWWEKSAQLGLTNAMRETGRRYFEGIGVRKNLDRSILWLTEAAKQGDVESQFFLGKLLTGYIRGGPLLCKPKDGSQWLCAAAENGHEEAAQLLASDFVYNPIWRCYTRKTGTV